MLIAAALNVVFVLYLKTFVDNLIDVRGFHYALLSMFLALIFLNVGMVMSWFIVDYTLELLKRKAQVNLWSVMYRKLVECPQKKLDEVAPGEYMSKILSDTGFVSSIIGAFLPALIVNATQFSSNIIAAALLSPVLTLAISLSIPLYFFLYTRQSKYMVSSTADERKAYGGLTESLRVKVEAIRTVKNLNVRKKIAGSFDADADSWYVKIKKVLFVEKRYALSVNFLRNIIPIIILGIGIYLTALTLISVGTLVAFFYFSLSFFNPLIVMSTDLGSLSQAVSPIQRINSVLTLPSEESGQKEIETIKDVYIQDVSFYYDHQPALCKIELKILKGEKVAIVGQSGSGKTTLLSLINRIYDPCEGEILFNGIRTREYDLESLRENTMLVTSKDMLFSGTIANNISLSDNYPKEELIRAAEIAGITEDSLTLEESIGPGTREVSEGQKQRICLARAILRKPEVLLLDEALSAIDSRLEGKIMTKLLKEFSDKTIIVVSHRLSTIVPMDRILVMKEGRVLADGKFEELSNSCQEFTSLMKRQIVQ